MLIMINDGKMRMKVNKEGERDLSDLVATRRMQSICTNSREF